MKLLYSIFFSLLTMSMYCQSSLDNLEGYWIRLEKNDTLVYDIKFQKESNVFCKDSIIPFINATCYSVSVNGNRNYHDGFYLSICDSSLNEIQWYNFFGTRFFEKINHIDGNSLTLEFKNSEYLFSKISKKEWRKILKVRKIKLRTKNQDYLNDVN